MADRYEGREITVINRSERCIHARYCVLTATDVFVPNADGAWIKPDAVTAEKAISVIERCPSGALAYERRDGGEGERPPRVNSIRVLENGPLAVHADLRVSGEAEPQFRATLCRCGHSQNKPFCDGAHNGAEFSASGEPKARASNPLKQRGGPLDVQLSPNGPLIFSGPLEICGASGRTVDRVTKTALCRCGSSASKPYCDGTHARIGFVAP